MKGRDNILIHGSSFLFMLTIKKFNFIIKILTNNKLQMGDSLYNWCMDKKEEHPELNFNCDDLKDGSEEGQEDLLTDY